MGEKERRLPSFCMKNSQALLDFSSPRFNDYIKDEYYQVFGTMKSGKSGIQYRNSEATGLGYSLVM